MIVTCPSCSKRYMLDDALLPKEGRPVRCIVCHHVWRQTPVPHSQLTPPPFLGFPDIDNPVEGSKKSKKRKRWLGWFFFILLLLCGVAGLVLGRNMVVSLWPKSERIYELFSLHINLPGAGLAITNATSLVRPEGTRDMIVVAGDLVNTSDLVRPIPPLKVKLVRKIVMDNQSKDEILDHWEHRLSENSLLPGEHIHFETVARPKPTGTQYVSIEF